jgi:hypothetical protein
MILKKSPVPAFIGISYLILFALTVILFIKCEDETMKPREYPRLSSKPVSDISEAGATFNGDLYSLGTTDIIQHGFVWGIIDEPKLNNNKILLGPLEVTGIFSAAVVSTLSRDIEYTVRPFVQTASQTVYGNPVKFVSLGSGAPVITGFGPDSAAWMDTLYITGKNFSWVPGDNIVKLNQAICKSVSSTDTTISVLVGTGVVDLKSILSVELAGNYVVHSTDTFRLIAPVITEFYPKVAGWGDTITVKGRNLQNKGPSNSVSATIDVFVSKVISTDLNSVVLIMPGEANQLTNVLSLKINNLTIHAQKPISLKPPVINSISPEEGTWGDVMTLKGRFHPDKTRNKIEIGGIVSELIMNNRDSIRVRVPVNLTNHDNLVTNTTSPFVITATETFKLFGPRIDSITPLSGPTGTDCLIRGDYLEDFYGNNIVKFGSQNATNFSGGSKQLIICEVPVSLGDGPVEIKVIVGNQSAIYRAPFIVKNPHISNIYPLIGTFNDTLTIEGENLPLRPTVLFNSCYAENVYASDTKLLVKVPLYVDSIPSTIKIRVAGSAEFFYQGKFILNPPEITSVPSVLSRGNYFNIEGRNFNPLAALNYVYIGSQICDVYNSTTTRISSKVPSLVPGQYHIIIMVGGYKRYSELCEIR